MKNYKIVVCDDSKDMRDMIYNKLKILDNINFDVVLADDRTIDLSQEYDAYLLDIEMPHTNGFALATKIHSLYMNTLRHVKIKCFIMFHPMMHAGIMNLCRVIFSHC